MLETIIIIVGGGFLAATAYYWFGEYYDLKRQMEENDDFEKLMRKQLELDAARLKAQEDLLREACRSQAEEEYEEHGEN